MPYDCPANPFVRNAKVNIWPIAAVELEDWPYRRAHLLALHVRGVPGNTQSQKSNKGAARNGHRFTSLAKCLSSLE